MITFLIPAHNESKNVAAAIESLKNQTVPVDRIVVVDDRSTDDTAALAIIAGADVFHVDPENQHKKAGALNEALEWHLNYTHYSGFVGVMDADSILDPRFVETALDYFTKDPRYGGIGGTFTGRVEKGNFVEFCQANEYVRYQRDVNRKRGRVLVLTGTATIFRTEALEEVRWARRELDVGRSFYDTEVLTEDNELTFALRHLGWKVRSPEGCTLTTELMPSWRALGRQRLRWKRGAMENLVQYGLTRYTAEHWGYQVVGFLGIVVTALYLSSTAWMVATGNFHLIPFWLLLTALFAVERAVTVRKRGWWAMVVGGMLVPEMVYDLFLQGVHIRALAGALTKREARW